MNSVCCMYLRISKEDGENSESNSISNQRDIIKNYAKLNNLKIKKEYVDDGYSGAVSTRPAFNRMINDLEKNKINTIIVDRKSTRLNSSHQPQSRMPSSA